MSLVSSEMLLGQRVYKRKLHDCLLVIWELLGSLDFRSENNMARSNSSHGYHLGSVTCVMPSDVPCKGTTSLEVG